MPTSRLTQHRVDTLKPRKNTYEVRDADLVGFGVRVLPSGCKRYFLHSQIDSKRVWNAIGDTEDIILERARAQARAMLASRRYGGEPASGTCEAVPFEMAADEVFLRYRRHWKPGTLKVESGGWRASFRVRWYNPVRRGRSRSEGNPVTFVPVLSPAPMATFPGPCSSNRTCGFPASGFRTRSCIRPRKVTCLQPKAGKAVVMPQFAVREAHVPPRP